MVRRTLTALLLLAIVLPIIYIGGPAYVALVILVVGIAAWEYCLMFRIKALEPAAAIVLAAISLIMVARAFWAELAGAALALGALVSIGYHLYRYERGRDQAAVDLSVTLGGIVYLGWIAAYFIDLRSLPNGMWWLLLVFVIVWVADAAAYFVGVNGGRHKMLPRLSPKKSWEGYLGGVVAGTLAAGLVSLAGRAWGPIELALIPTLALGLLLSTLTTLGDIAESLFKRFAGIKDSGSFLPGHGGAFDRIDSLIWAGVLGYYWIRYMML